MFWVAIFLWKTLRNFPKLGGRFEYFLFFLLGGVQNAGREEADGFLSKIPRGGGVSWAGGGGSSGREGVCGGFFWGGAKCFFFGAEIPTKKRVRPSYACTNNQNQKKTSTSFCRCAGTRLLRFSRPFCHAARWAFTLRLATLSRETREVFLVWLLSTLWFPVSILIVRSRKTDRVQMYLAAALSEGSCCSARINEEKLKANT